MKLKKVVMSIAFGLLSVSLFAQWGSKVKGNGREVTVERQVGEYESISVAGSYEVTLVQGKEGEISISGEENLVEHIVTEVSNGKLTIKTERYFNLIPSLKSTNIRIKVPVKDIEGITLSGSGSVVTDLTLRSPKFNTTLSGSGDISAAVDTDELKVTISGSGDIKLNVKASEVKVQIAGSGDSELKGTTERIEVNVSGSGDLYAFDLLSNTADINIAGSADVKVNVREMLRTKIVGSGDVHYKGNPRIDSKIVGSGDLIKH